MDFNSLKDILDEERKLYFPTAKIFREYRRYRHKRYYIWKYIMQYRKKEFYKCLLQKNNELFFIRKIIVSLLYRYYKFELGINHCGLEISGGSYIGKCLDIYHEGVIINGSVGDYCVFHGNNVVGNKGIGREKEIPAIGNHVDVGAGAVIIGAIEIAEGCMIGANAVVTKSCLEPNSVLCGVPAHIC